MQPDVAYGVWTTNVDWLRVCEWPCDASCPVDWIEIRDSGFGIRDALEKTRYLSPSLPSLESQVSILKSRVSSLEMTRLRLTLAIGDWRLVIGGRTSGFETRDSGLGTRSESAV